MCVCVFAGYELFLQLVSAILARPRHALGVDMPLRCYMAYGFGGSQMENPLATRPCGPRQHVSNELFQHT